MRQLLRPAFVTTVSALAIGAGCKKTDVPPETEPQPTPNPPAYEDPPSPTASASASPKEAKGETRKRKRTASAADPSRGDGSSPKKPRVLNPTDVDGRRIHAGYDDRCSVEVPPKGEPPKNLPPGMPWKETVYVDCPPAMDDPAWDHCAQDLVLDEGTKACFCVATVGNPPPPPRKQACPAETK